MGVSMPKKLTFFTCFLSGAAHVWAKNHTEAQSKAEDLVPEGFELVVERVEEPSEGGDEPQDHPDTPPPAAPKATR